MPATKTKAPRNQIGAWDKRIEDRDKRAAIAEAVETMDENLEAARAYNAARKTFTTEIAEDVQKCEPGDRLEVCDGTILDIKLFTRGEFTVPEYAKNRAVRPGVETVDDDPE